jgi:hypothetical protein
MFEEDLKKYALKGEFSFKLTDSLTSKCNAPSDKSGVYLIYKVINGIEELIYIGSSGQKVGGVLKTRQTGMGGMKDRIVNGYHPKFGKIKRHKSFPIQMKKELITELKFYWWVTFEGENIDFPTDIETILREKYRTKFTKLPEWHK